MKTPLAVKVEILEGLRRGLAKVAHHEAFTRRVKATLEKELPEGCSVTVTPADSVRYSSSNEISVWPPRIPGQNHPERVEIRAWLDSSKPGDTWQAAFERAIQREDPRDYAEREIEEAKLAPKLAKLEAQIVALRAEASALIAALPVPMAAFATLRNDRAQWTTERPETRESFPHCFKSLTR